MKGLTRLALIAVAAVGMGLVASAPSYAIHRGAGGLVCGGCHTMHNSQGRVSLEGLATNPGDGATGGSLILLRGDVSAGRSQIHNLCLQCHAAAGSRATDVHAPHSRTAPKVLLAGATSPWDENMSFSRIGAGGDFNDACGGGAFVAGTCADNGAGLGKGHSLGATTVTPPGSTGSAGLDYLTCTNCHDPHGVISTFTTSTIANTYRMLRKYPTGSGASGGASVEGTAATISGTWSYIGGIAGEGVNNTPIDSLDGTTTITTSTNAARAIWPIFRNPNATGGMDNTPATDTANSNYYSSDIANWCAACHDNWHETKNTPNNVSGNDWKRHPVDNFIIDGTPNSGATVLIIDPNVDPAADADDTYNVFTAGTAVPVVSGAANKTWYLQNATTDKVFCLSCHFPHGSPYNDILRWNYTSAVGSGTQDGNAVPANRGCQLCHNRGGE